MDPTTAAVITATAGTSSGGIFTIVSILLVVVIPFIVKFWNWSKETSAQGILYSQLSEMVQKQRQELDTMYVQRTVLQEQVFELRNKVEHLESCEGSIDILKKKLDQKDIIIAERDSRIAHLLEELLKMKDRVHNLELRLKQDESQWCNGCQYKSSQYLPPIVRDEEK